jgi:hypothetical protein
VFRSTQGCLTKISELFTQKEQTTEASPTIALMGGLGNQLFQVAKSISHEGSQLWHVDTRLMRPRLGLLGTIEIFSSPIFSTQVRNPKPVRRFHRFTRPTYPLRTLALWVLSGRFEELSSGKQKCAKLAILLAGYVYTHRLTKIQIGKHEFGKSGLFKSKFFIGFFQDLSNLEFTIALQKFQVSIDKYEKSEAELDESNFLRNLEILVVHMRRGDFAQHPTIGMLSMEYYKNAITRACTEKQYNQIWFFSDDVTAVHNFLRVNEFGVDAVVQERPGMEALTILRLMQKGTGFVLSNSTLGWWAAALAHSRSAKIYSPVPWTQRHSLDVPPKLPNSTGVPADFE